MARRRKDDLEQAIEDALAPDAFTSARGGVGGGEPMLTHSTVLNRLVRSP